MIRRHDAAMRELIALFGSAKEMADALDVSLTTIYNWIRWGRVPHTAFGKLIENTSITLPVLRKSFGQATLGRPVKYK